MFIIDTSVWIDYFNQTHTHAVKKFEDILAHHYPFGITGVIYQEILQGAGSPESFARLQKYLSTQRFYHPRDPISTHAAAALLYNQCRRAGITIRSSIDCLIAQLAIEHDLLLVHSDKDFDRLAQVVPTLRVY